MLLICNGVAEMLLNSQFSRRENGEINIYVLRRPGIKTQSAAAAQCGSIWNGWFGVRRLKTNQYLFAWCLTCLMQLIAAGGGREGGGGGV